MQQMQNAQNGPGSASASVPSAEDLAALALETAPLIMRLIRQLMRADREAGLSTPQFRALGYVSRHSGTSLSQVAEHLGLSTPATSRLIDALVDRELVERAIAPEDRRYITLRLTARGEAVQAAARARALRGLSAVMEGLTPAERLAVADALPMLRQLFAAETPPATQ
jgi:DNA-binding MarR family transcriptional regulator